jgi:hypothetical protein
MNELNIFQPWMRSFSVANPIRPVPEVSYPLSDVVPPPPGEMTGISLTCGALVATTKTKRWIFDRGEWKETSADVGTEGLDEYAGPERRVNNRAYWKCP